MKWKLSSPEPQILVYYFLKLLGLAPITLKRNKFHPPTLVNIFYLIFLTIVHFGLIARITTEDAKKVDILPHGLQLFSFETVINATMGNARIFLTLLLFSTKYKKTLYIINKLHIIGKELKSLGIEEDLGKIFNKLFLTIVVANALHVVACVTLSCIDLNWSTSTLIKYSLDTGFHMNTNLLFGQILIFIKQRFKLLNDKLHDLFRPSVHLRSFQNSQSNARGENRGDIENLTDNQRILKIDQLHLDLTELVDETANQFAISIVIESLRFLVEMILCSNGIYTIIVNSNVRYDPAEMVPFALEISPILLKIVFAISNIFIIVHASEKICEQGNATKAVVFNVWYKFKPRELADEFYMFSLRMLHKPVAVSAFGFFNLGYSLVWIIFYTALTYLIITIQFEIPQHNPSA